LGAHLVGAALAFPFALDLSPRNGGQDASDHAAHVGGQVDVAGRGGDAHAVLLGDRDQLLQRDHGARHAVEMPGDDDVALAGLDHAHKPGPSGAIDVLLVGGYRVVRDHFDDFPTPRVGEGPASLLLATDGSALSGQVKGGRR